MYRPLRYTIILKRATVGLISTVGEPSPTYLPAGGRLFNKNKMNNKKKKIIIISTVECERQYVQSIQ